MVTVARAPDTARSGHMAVAVLAALAGSVLLALGAMCWAGTSGTGLALAAELTGRLAVLFFVALLIVEPLARLVPHGPLKGAERERMPLTFAFAVVMVVSLACMSAPSALSAAPGTIPVIAYCLFTAGILFVLVAGAVKSHSAAGARAMQGVATVYFWVVFASAAIVHLNGPHRPDGWFGLSLLLLIAALLIRFADALRNRLAGKVG